MDQAPFFYALRDVRVGIEHHGKNMQHVYADDQGFRVRAEDPVFSSVFEWPEDQISETGLAPLNPFLAHVINETLMALNRAAAVLGEAIEWPDPVAPGYHVFLRGYHIHRLGELPLNPDDDPWFRSETSPEDNREVSESADGEVREDEA